MVACPLCILGVPEEDHSPERFASITEEEHKIISEYNKKHPGVILSDTEELEYRNRRTAAVLADARKRAGEEGIGF